LRFQFNLKRNILIYHTASNERTAFSHCDEIAQINPELPPMIRPELG
jgi:hypothetical protein